MVTLNSDVSKSWQSWYENTYLPAAEKLRGTPYENQAFNNPYAQWQSSGGSVIGNLLADSGLGSVLNFLTFGLSEDLGVNLNSTAQSKLNAERQQAAMEELQRLFGLSQENAMNSPAEQAMRMIAAGQNPQLLGTGGVAGAAKNGGPDETGNPTAPSALGGEDTGVLQSLGQGITSFFGGMLNMYKFFQESESRSIANSASDVSLLDSVYETAVSQAAGLSSLPATREEYDALSDADKLGVDQTVYDTIKQSIANGHYKSMGMNKRALRMLKTMTGRVMYDADGKPTLAFQKQRAAMLKGFYGDTLAAGEAAGHPTMSDPEQFSSVIDACVKFFGEYEAKLMDAQKKIADLMAPTYEAQKRTAEAQATSAEAQSMFDQGMYDRELGEKENAARKAEADMRKVTSELDSYLDKQMDELMTGLDSYGISGRVAKIGLVSLRSFLRSLTMNLNPLTNKKTGALTGFAPSFGIQ